jgi:hypothetical protein
MATIKRNPSPAGEPGCMAPQPSPDDDDGAEVVNSWHWITVLASPPLYRTIRRTVDPAYVVRMIDVIIAYAERGAQYMHPQFSLVRYERRVPLAKKLRALIVEWTPPDLPAEITATARELLHAEGQVAPEGGWDALSTDPDPVEDILVWAEGISMLRGRRGGAA